MVVFSLLELQKLMHNLNYGFFFNKQKDVLIHLFLSCIWY